MNFFIITIATLAIFYVILNICTCVVCFIHCIKLRNSIKRTRQIEEKIIEKLERNEIK